MERELFFRLIQEKNYSAIIESMRDVESFESVYNDTVFKSVFEANFVSEILQNPTKISDEYIAQISRIYQFNVDKDHPLSLDNTSYKKLTLKLLEFTNDIKYARCFPDEEISKEVIRKNKEKIDESIRIERTQRKENELFQKFSLEEVRGRDTSSFVIPIFKSQQEHDFYQAAKEVFPKSILLPNAAISTVINNSVLQILPRKERHLFLTSTIDLVIVDRISYRPLYFFELDSSFHDTPKQKEKDGIKDKLISDAGFSLYRIRKTTGRENVQDFRDLLDKII